MFPRIQCVHKNIFARVNQFKPSSERYLARKYSVLNPSMKTSPSVKTKPIPTPESLRRLRAKENRWRKSIMAGVLFATGTAYYLDGKYNSRAVRRTLRTAWTGVLLAVDYKWNFT